MKIPEEVGSKYRFIVLAGQRVAQLQRGATPRVEGLEEEKLTTIAMAEVLDNKITFHEKESALKLAPNEASPLVNLPENINV